MLVFSMTTTQIHYLKANTCKKNKRAEMFPFQRKGVVPLPHVALGFPAASLGGSGPLPSKVCWHFVLLDFPSHDDDLPATGLAQGPQEGGSHRRINARSLLLVLCTQKEKSAGIVRAS